MISLRSLATTTKGIDIYNAVVNALAEKEIDPYKIVSVTTDGARNMTGEVNGFVSLFAQLVGHSILGFHCIIHQQALSAKTSLKSLDDIMVVVTQLVNFLSARPLNKRKFSQLLTEVNSVYNGLLMHNSVRWLSRGKVLQRFVDCLDEIRLFLNNENLIEKFNQILNTEWVLKLMFFTDLCSHLNELNLKLQGSHKTIIIIFDIIIAFKNKLEIFNRDIISNIYKYFPNTRNFFENLDSYEYIEKPKLTKTFSEIIQTLIKEFASRFQEFETFAETSKFIMFPDTIPINNLNLKIFKWMNLEDLEIELVDFQSSSIWKQKFVNLRNELETIENNRLLGTFNKKADEELLKTWNAIPATFSSLKKLATAILTIFSSTYACESVFSELNFIKNKFRNRMIDESSAACVLIKVSKYDPDLKYLSSNKQQQKSH